MESDYILVVKGQGRCDLTKHIFDYYSTSHMIYLIILK